MNTEFIFHFSSLTNEDQKRLLKAVNEYAEEHLKREEFKLTADEIILQADLIASKVATTPLEKLFVISWILETLPEFFSNPKAQVPEAD